MNSLTFDFHAGLSTQPLEERPHHFCTAETLEAAADVLVVPLQSADLQDSMEKKQEVFGIFGTWRNIRSHVKLQVLAWYKNSLHATSTQLCLNKQQKNGS